MKLVNLTPHAINLILGDATVTVAPSGSVARCAVSRQQVGTVEVEGHAVPVFRSVFGAVEGLPAPQPGVGFVVSALVASAVPERQDVYGVDDAVRNEAGQVVGCRALSVR